MTSIERLQGTLQTLGLSAIEAKLEGLLERASVLLQIAECRREALISHSETYAGTPKIEWMN